MLSGSDDGNVRMWKARASEKLGIIDTRERAAMEYRDSLKERWKFDKEVGKISRYVSPPQYSVNDGLTHAWQNSSHSEAGPQGRAAQTHDAGGFLHSLHCPHPDIDGTADVHILPPAITFCRTIAPILEVTRTLRKAPIGPSPSHSTLEY